MRLAPVQATGGWLSQSTPAAIERILFSAVDMTEIGKGEFAVRNLKNDRYVGRAGYLLSAPAQSVELVRE